MEKKKNLAATRQTGAEPANSASPPKRPAAKKQPKKTLIVSPALVKFGTRPSVRSTSPGQSVPTSGAFSITKVKGKARVVGPTPVPGARAVKGNRLTSGPVGVGLSHCAALYAHALCNPFGEIEELPCVPCAPPTESYRFKCLTRGSFVTSATTGVGFVMVQPQNAANDIISVRSTLATSGSTGYDYAALGKAVSTRPGRPFPNAQFSSQDEFLQWKLVALGLRCRNFTQALNVGGILYGTRLPNGEDLAAYTLDETKASPYTVVSPIALEEQGVWQYLHWRPTDATDLTYPDEPQDFNAAPGPGNSITSSMGFLVEAPAISTPQLYEWELIEYWEFAGQGASVVLPEVQPSHSDSVGLDRVLEASQLMPETLSKEENVEHMAHGIVESMAHSDTVSKTIEDLLGLAGLAVGPVSKLVKSLVSLFML